ncbi:histidine phosphatase family protein [Streptomyces sp. CSDS2]|uniref:histidine phosphatase family protein n=1 Tax=Streptomyces sp. CSDS2 TaxID=3055051 RepID=UPI0025B1437A|nr:histidine phosphatase family protein [Streptomyces sp. CSDS2]MDN3260424.1 histidine phosphatase family protein [Streptomyces sp. CSDS2]
MSPAHPVPADDTGTSLAPPCALGALWAVRHGQSTANRAFALAERSGTTALPVSGRDRDVPLSPLGLAQAHALGDWLAGQPPASGPDLVVCSPFTRARQTWQAMADRARRGGAAPLPVLVDERVRDREMGVFELHPPTALRARAPEEADRRERLGEWWYRPPGGEALTDVAVRVGQFVSDLQRAAPSRRVLVVAHDAVVIGLRHVLAGIGAPAPDRLPPVPNASVSSWRGDGQRLHPESWGDTAHLGVT